LDQPQDGAPPGSGGISRREFVKGAGVAAAASSLDPLGGAAQGASSDGTPEQIHLTWGEDPTRSVFVSWATPSVAHRPRVLIPHQGTATAIIAATERTYTDALSGQRIFTYHARIGGLAADHLYRYSVTADNDRRWPEPFTATFRTAPRGRRPFRWTSYGDLATPDTRWLMSSPQSRHAVDAVERFEPLFHLLNGDLCYANVNPTAQPAVWAAFGNNVQRSAAYRPWMPCPGNHEVEFGNGEHGLDAYLTRYSLPENGTRFQGRWYRFQVGSVLFVSLDADDVVYQDSGAFVSGPEPLRPGPASSHPAIPPGTSLYVRGYSACAQTRWLEQTLSAAASNVNIDWIIVQMHQDALSSSKTGNGSDMGIREAWLPLFDRYGVDLVLCGHDHDYERSWPVRGCAHGTGRDAGSGEPVDTCQPLPVMTTDPPRGRYDTNLGTIHMILGGGGTSTPVDVYGVDPGTGTPQAKVITKRNRPMPGPVPGVFVKPGADAVEAAIWSARRDPTTGYGIAVFDVDPDGPTGKTSITLRYYHAVGADRSASASYELFDTIVLEKLRRAPG
jgi:3',5'-cyclic AMP phosphodiesterase CpdA